MQIRDGGYYKQRNGLIRGPMLIDDDGTACEVGQVSLLHPTRWDDKGVNLPRIHTKKNEGIDLVEEMAVFPMPQLSPRDGNVANDEDGYILEFVSDYAATDDDCTLYLFTQSRLLDMIKTRDSYSKRMVSMNVRVDTTEAREQLNKALEKMATSIAQVVTTPDVKSTNISPEKVYTFADGLAQSITDAISVHGFENDRDAATVLSNQKKPTEFAIAERMLDFLRENGVSTFHDGGVVKGSAKTAMSEHAADPASYLENAKSWAEGGFTGKPGLKPNEVAGVVSPEKVGELYTGVMRKAVVSLEDFRNKAETILGKGKPKEFIVAAAIHHGGIISLPRPARHHTILQTLDTEMQIGGVINPQQQGFITSTGRYVNRTEAWYIALAANQIIRKSTDDTPNLYSEDLW